jgi:hypothetical protein
MGPELLEQAHPVRAQNYLEAMLGRLLWRAQKDRQVVSLRVVRQLQSWLGNVVGFALQMRPFERLRIGFAT